MRPEDLEALQGGCCSRSAAAEKGCALCVPRYAAIDRVLRTIGAADTLRARAVSVCGHFAGARVDDLEDAVDAYDRVRGCPP